MPSVFYEQRFENLFFGPICDHAFPAHVHDPVEIVCLFEGEAEMMVAGTKYMVGPGDVIISFPSVMHSYEYVSDDADGLTLIFLPEAIAEFNGAFRSRQPVSPLLRADGQPDEMKRLIRQMKELSVHEDSPLRLGYLHLFLSFMFSVIPLQPIEKRLQSGLSFQVLHYISEHFTEPLTLESTAHALGISRIHLSHIFSQQLHINFRSYINTLRIDRACFLLRDPTCSVSQVAYLCGYGNPRTFHRAFMLKRNTTPSRYRAALFGHETDG